MNETSSAGATTDYETCEVPAAPALERLLDYWNERRGARLAPARADIDPAAITPLLPDVMLMDVIEGGRDFRFRLIGTRIVEGLGRDSTGRLLSDVYADQPLARQRLLDRFQVVLRSRRPLFGRGRIYWVPDRGHKSFASAHLPLSHDGASVNIILVALIIDRAG